MIWFDPVSLTVAPYSPLDLSHTFRDRRQIYLATAGAR